MTRRYRVPDTPAARRLALLVGALSDPSCEPAGEGSRYERITAWLDTYDDATTSAAYGLHEDGVPVERALALASEECRA